MSDEIKIIREALVEVQKKIEEKNLADFSANVLAGRPLDAVTSLAKSAGTGLRMANKARLGAVNYLNPDIAKSSGYKEDETASPEQKKNIDAAIERATGKKLSTKDYSSSETTAPTNTPSTTPKSDTTTTPKPTGSVTTNDKPTSVVKTKGGDYNVYAKDSEKASDFRKTYADAKGDFEWEGRKYAKPSSEVKTSTPAAVTNEPKKESPPPAMTSSDVNSMPKMRLPDSMGGSEPKPKEERESGGKKKMSEETNPLIAAVLRLQEKNTIDKNLNMFTEAKKAKKDYDGDGKVESPKDEVWGSRFAAAKKAGKMEEGNIDPVVTGSKTVTSSPKGYVDPSTPTQPYTKAPVSTAAGDVLDKAKNALDKTGVKEEAEVTFSQAEIDHINSFFLEASVAPNRPEVAIGADSVSDKMSQNDVTGTHTESGGKKKKIKEEVDLDETTKPEVSVYDNAAHVKDKMGKVVASYSKKDHGADYMKKANAHMSKIKEETDAADETNMAKTQLKAMSSKAMNLHSKLKTSKKLPAWVQSKLAVAKDGVTSVDDYMTHSGKIKEEIELDEAGMPASVIASKKKYAEMSDKDFAENHGHKSEKELRDMAARHGYGWDKATKTGSDHYVKRVAAANKINEEHKSMEGETLKPGDQVGYKEGHEKYGHIHSISPEGHAKIKVWNDNTGDYHHVTKHVSKLWKEGTNEETISEGRPKKNPTPETTERDPRKHIQVEAGRAAAGNVIDFHHNDGSKSKITPAMGRRIVSHLNGLKPADRQSAVNKMHDSPEGLKV